MFRFLFSILPFCVLMGRGQNVRSYSSVFGSDRIPSFGIMVIGVFTKSPGFDLGIFTILI